jgi:hypothetical protein
MLTRRSARDGCVRESGFGIGLPQEEEGPFAIVAHESLLILKKIFIVDVVSPPKTIVSPHFQ